MMSSRKRVNGDSRNRFRGDLVRQRAQPARILRANRHESDALRAGGQDVRDPILVRN